MKKMLLALAAAAAFTGSAQAADLAARPYKAAPMVAPAPVANWTGCWISGGGGYGLFRVNHDERFTSFATGGPAGVVNSTVGGDGWLGTGGIGCDYQFAGRWLVGVFADGTFSDIKGDGMTRIRGVTGDALVGELKSDWSWAVGGRLGYVVNPSLMTYFSAGYTQAHFTQQNLSTVFTNPSLVTGVAIPGQTFDGLFVGTGVEYSFDWLPGLFVRSEGRAAWYDRKDAIPFCATGGSFCAGPAATAAPGAVTDSRRPIIYTAKTELVYRFNWGGPVVARY